MSNLGKTGYVGHEQGGVAGGFSPHKARIGGDQAVPLIQVSRVFDKARGNTHTLRSQTSEQGMAPTEDHVARDEFVSDLGQMVGERKDSVLARGCHQAALTTFQGGQSLLQDIGGGICVAAVAVSMLLVLDDSCSMSDAFERVDRALNNRRHE